jgi:hypothetical protein
MKKVLLAALLSLAGVGLGAGQAHAWLFCHKCCNKCGTICIRPYNAFTPSVFGSITADGCSPLNFGCQLPPPPPWFQPPWAGGAGCCAMDGSGCGSCTAGVPGMTAPIMLPPGNVAPAMQAPAPTAPVVVPNGAGAQAYPTGIQSAGYSPVPWVAPYPAAWNTNGR